MANPKIVVEYLADVSDLRKASSQVESTSGKIGAGVKKAFIPAIAAFAAVGVAAKRAIDDASNLSEQVNKAGQVFGKAAPPIVAWSKTTANALGISQRAALEATGTFGNMLVPMGFSRDKAAAMSKSMVTLAGDMASFNNASPQDTLEALRSGLAGETEPLRKYGVFLNDARIKQEAFNLGLTKRAQAAAAANAAVKTATAAVAAATSARTAAESKLNAASTAVTATENAVASAAAKVASAQERVRDSTEHLADARAGHLTAIQKTRDAETANTNAMVHAVDAQIALTDARKKATQQLDDLRNAATDSGLGEERATIALDRARERLATVTADATSTDLDRRDAMLGVREAEQSAIEASKQRAKVAADLTNAERLGVNGSKDVADARDAVTKANQDSLKSTRALHAAQAAQADSIDTVLDALRGMHVAQKNLANEQGQARDAAASHTAAVANLATAQHRSAGAANALAGAQANLTSAQQEAAKFAGVNTKNLTAQQKAMATYSIIMKDTKDTQGDFQRTSSGLANQQRIQAATAEDLSAKMGKNLLPAMQAFEAISVRVLGVMAKNPAVMYAVAGAVAVAAAAIIALNIAMGVAAVVGAPWIGTAALITAGVVALIAVAVLLAKHWDDVKDTVSKAFRVIGDAAKWLFNWLKSNWPLLLAILTGPIGVATLAIIKNWDTLKGAVASAVDAIKDTVSGAWNTIRNITVAVWDAIVGFIRGVVADVKGLFTGLASWVSGFATGVWTTAINGVRNVFGWISDAARFAVQTVKDLFNGLVGFIENIVGRVSSAATSIANAIKAPINALVGAWNKLAFHIPKVSLPKVHIPLVGDVGGESFGGWTINFPDLPKLARGGIVSSPTLAMIGEGRGNEIVTPEAMLREIVGQQSVNVRVFIGETELKGLIDARVDESNTGLARTLLAGGVT